MKKGAHYLALAMALTVMTGGMKAGATLPEEKSTAESMYGPLEKITVIDAVYGNLNGGLAEIQAIPTGYTTVSVPSVSTVSITSSGTSKWFKFTAPESKRYAMKAISNGLDTDGVLYNSAGTKLASSNDGRVMHNQKDTHISEVLTAGNVYYVEMKLKSTTPTGSFQMYLYEDDCPDGIYNAIALENQQVSTRTGVINYAQDRDMYTFTPSVSGSYMLSASGDISLITSVYASDRSLISAGAAGTASAATVELTAGTLYYVEVRGGNASVTGDYRVNVLYRGSVTNMTAPSNRTVTLSQSEGTKVFSFTPAVTGRYTARARSNGLSIAGYLFDSSGRWLATSQKGRVLYDNLNDFNLYEELQAGQTYYIAVKGWSSTSTGSFGLYLYQDDCTGGSYYPTPLSVGTAHSGKIEYAYDSDMYQITPDFSGTYTFNAGENMTGTLYNSSRQQIKTSAGSFTESLTGGQSYYFEIRHSVSNGTGNYQARVSLTQPTGFGVLAEGGSATASGSVGYRLTPSQARTYTVSAVGAETGKLYTADGQEIDSFSPGETTMTRELSTDVYYAYFTGSNMNVVYYGDDAGNELSRAHALTLDQIFSGQIEIAGDRDVYSFTPQISGTYLFGTDQSSGMNGTLYRSDGTAVATDNNGGECMISADLIQDQTYYLSLEGQQSGDGYQVGVSLPIISVTGAASMADNTASVQITEAGERKVFRFVPAESGIYTVKSLADQTAWGGLYQFLGGSIQEETGFAMTRELTAGATYYISTGYTGIQAGSYTVAAYRDDYSDKIGEGCTAFTGSVNGVINHAADVDVFRWIPEESGFTTVNCGNLTAVLRDSSGAALAQSEGGILQYSIQSGTTYYLELSGATGNYSVTAATAAGGVPVTAAAGEIVDMSCHVEWESAITSTYTVAFRADEFEICDLCGFTYAKETTAGLTAGGVTVLSVTPRADGTVAVTFRTNGLNGYWLKKTANLVRLKAKKTGTFVIDASVERT